MNFDLIKRIMHTKVFRALIIFTILYFIGYAIFMIWINPDTTKTPGQPGMFLRDFLWIIYWRWYLNWPIIIGFIGFGTIATTLMNRLSRKISTPTLATYVWPLILMGFNYVGMIAIDIAVTYFADGTFNGTWYSPQILLFGLDAEKIYHGFFFWFMPALIIIGVPVTAFIYNKQYRIFFRTLFVLMAGFSLCLGFIDPVVSQDLWNNWQIFGTWAMMGYDPMWATGWIAHYVILGCFWLMMAWLVKRLLQELDHNSSKAVENSE